MKNLKHSIVAIIAVAMISSLSAVQSADTKRSKYIASGINTGAASGSISISAEAFEAEESADNESVQEEEYSIEAEIEMHPEAAEKVNLAKAYASLTSGTLNVRQTPSTEANVIGELTACEEVTVLGSSEGWCEISYDGGKTGYVIAQSLTTDKALAEYNAMNYNNYKKAIVKSNGEALNVRSGPNTSSNIITTLIDNTTVIALWTEGDFIRIAYGDNYDEGYVINTGIELTGEWIQKSVISKKQEEVAAAKAAAAKKTQEKKIAITKSAHMNVSASSSSKGQAIVNTAKKYLGVPYVWGGTSPRGFDCSGLVQYVCRQNGISVNRVAADQIRNGTRVSKSNLEPGDLVFFGKGRINHVGIYVGNGQMIHAPQTGDVVKIVSINSGYYASRYVGATRVY